ncbi:MAG TPA: class I SAM-dependent methyltransferase [Solirubrobacterales bacterium]|nr:class I SAM-dependent methyltransferase [Solirubrobacterales bacterium]
MSGDFASARAAIDAVDPWYHRIEVMPGLTTPGVNDSQLVLRALDLPADLSGLRVLDIGTRDGFFAFECERRGAEVTAVDYMPAEETGFPVARELLGSQVDFVQENVYELSYEKYGGFDLVLFLGVLYHLRDPMLALDRIWDVCRGRLIVETQTIDDALLTPEGAFARLTDIDPRLAAIPLMQFFPGAALNNDPTCVWAPNDAALRAMLEEVGFSVESQLRIGQRGLAFATWQDDPERRYWRRRDRAVGRLE